MEKASNVLESESRKCSDFSRLASFVSKLQASFITGVIIYLIVAKLFIKEGSGHYDAYNIVVQVVFWTMLVSTICSSIMIYMLGMDNDDLTVKNRQLRTDNLLRTRVMSSAEQQPAVAPIPISELLTGQKAIMKSLYEALEKIEGYKETMHETNRINERLETLQKSLKESIEFQYLTYDGDIRYRILQMYHVGRYKDTLKEDPALLKAFFKTMARFRLLKADYNFDWVLANRLHYPVKDLDMSVHITEQLHDNRLYEVADLLLYDERFGDRMGDLEEFEIRIIDRKLKRLVGWFKIGLIPELIMKANINIK